MMPLFDLTQVPTRHSYSSLSLYKECPAKYGYRHIQRMADEPTSAMMRGTRLHSLAEHYMKAAQGVPAPHDLRRIGLHLYQLRCKNALAEETWCVNAAWEPVEADDPTAKLKAIVDVHYVNTEVVHIHDYKSGRQYPSHADQLELYSLMGLCRYPSARRAESSALYIDSGTEGPTRSIIRGMFPALSRKWGDLIGRLEGDVAFLPAPGNHCQRCSYASNKGGPCDAWRNQ